MAAKATAIGGDVPTNGAEASILMEVPYVATVKLKGTTDLLFHRWNCEAIAEKARASKGSKAKKTDDLESYVYRDERGDICIPGEYLRMSIVKTAKFRQDPRSTRKSAEDLFKAAIIAMTPLASLGTKEWQYEHACRAPVQRQGITRVRPAFRVGWEATFDLLVNLPEYVSPATLNEVIQAAGKFTGLGDFRPTYGRFQVVSFEVQHN